VGTVLGLFFILAAAATGVFVGTRPTVMDGRWIAAKLAKSAEDKGTTIECDRAIRVGVKGAEFACVHSRLGASQQIWYRMTRDGKLERTRAGRVKRDRGNEGNEGAASEAGTTEDGDED
jgi:hypothetical protein